MDGKTWSPLARRYLLPWLPGFEVRGRLIFRAPIDLVLCGLDCEPSGFSKPPFTVHVFADPLYIPKQHIAYTLGGRLGALVGRADRWWEYAPDDAAAIMEEVRRDMVAQGLPFFAKTSTPRDIANYIREGDLGGGRLPLGEVEGYSWLLADEPRDAELALVRAVMHTGSSEVPWIRQALERIEAVRSLIGTDIEGAKDLLSRWRKETMAALRLSGQAAE